MSIAKILLVWILSGNVSAQVLIPATMGGRLALTSQGAAKIQGVGQALYQAEATANLQTNTTTSGGSGAFGAVGKYLLTIWDTAHQIADGVVISVTPITSVGTTHCNSGTQSVASAGFTTAGAGCGSMSCGYNCYSYAYGGSICSGGNGITGTVDVIAYSGRCGGSPYNASGVNYTLNSATTIIGFWHETHHQQEGCSPACTSGNATSVETEEEYLTFYRDMSDAVPAAGNVSVSQTAPQDNTEANDTQAAWNQFVADQATPQYQMGETPTPNPITGITAVQLTGTGTIAADPALGLVPNGTMKAGSGSQSGSPLIDAAVAILSKGVQLAPGDYTVPNSTISAAVPGITQPGAFGTNDAHVIVDQVLSTVTVSVANWPANIGGGSHTVVDNLPTVSVGSSSSAVVVKLTDDDGSTLTDLGISSYTAHRSFSDLFSIVASCAPAIPLYSWLSNNIFSSGTLTTDYLQFTGNDPMHPGQHWTLDLSGIYNPIVALINIFIKALCIVQAYYIIFS